MALQSNADLRLLNGLLPVISNNRSDCSEVTSRFPNCWLFPGWGRQPHAQPPTWRTRSPDLYPVETGWSSCTPRHRVPILVAFYDTHVLQWDHSFPRSSHGDIFAATHHIWRPSSPSTTRGCTMSWWQGPTELSVFCVTSWHYQYKLHGS